MEHRFSGAEVSLTGGPALAAEVKKKITAGVRAHSSVKSMSRTPKGVLHLLIWHLRNRLLQDLAMYETILVTLDGTPTDQAIIEHVKQLAQLAHSRLVLLHVADGWAARTYGPDAVSPEISEDSAYLEKVRAAFQARGIPAQAELAYGDPAREIIRWVREKGCDLVAMSTHGHRFLADLFLGNTASQVQHSISVPVLLLRAK